MSQRVTREGTDWETVAWVRASRYRRRVIAHLATTGPSRPSAIARECFSIDYGDSAVCHALRQLGDEGLVTIKSESGNATLWALTDAGREIAPEVQES